MAFKRAPRRPKQSDSLPKWERFDKANKEWQKDKKKFDGLMKQINDIRAKGTKVRFPKGGIKTIKAAESSLAAHKKKRDNQKAKEKIMKASEK